MYEFFIDVRQGKKFVDGNFIEFFRHIFEKPEILEWEKFWLQRNKDLDKEIGIFAEKLASYNPEALLEMKRMLWQGTENWSTILMENAAISGELVLSDFTRNALAKFKK